MACALQERYLLDATVEGFESELLCYKQELHLNLL